MATQSPNEFFARLMWANLWNPQSPYYLPGVIRNGIHKDGIDVQPLENLSVANVPQSGSFELMKSDNLASWLPVKTGYIGIKFENVKINGLGNVVDGGFTYQDAPGDPNKGSFEAAINLPVSLQIQGQYYVVATGLAQCALDTAGALSFLPIPSINEALSTDEAGGGVVVTGDLGTAPGADGANDAPPLDQYLDAARAQRTRLWQTPNGGQLMDAFYDNNETYNWMFQNDLAVQHSWVDPANKYFSQQTYQASGSTSSAIVNNGTYADSQGNSTTYNQNAFAQQIAVTFSALGWAQNPPASSQLTSEDFNNAANAAMNFGSGPVATTGNTEDQTAPMTVDDVYNHVASAQNVAENGVMRLYVAEPQYTQETLPMSDFQRAHLKKIYAKAEATKAMLAANNSDASATMVQGTFSLEFSAGQLKLTSNITFPNTGSPTVQATALTSSLLVNAIDIQNISDWNSGAMSSIGHQIDKALEQSTSVRNLITDKINDALSSDDVLSYLTNWINTTLAKALGALLGEN